MKKCGKKFLGIKMKRICNIVTCGDVDSGKSTLFGRLLYNTNNVYEDVKLDVEKASKQYGKNNRLEYGFLLDGLQDERQQQITIDIAHRYFNIKDTRFHLLDCPGHSQYTNNFVIAATEADIAVLIIDSTKGIMPQTLIHLKICKLLQIKNIIIAITKIDLSSKSKVNTIETMILDNIKDFTNYKIVKTSAIKNINVDILTNILYKMSTSLDKDKSFTLCVQTVKKFKNERIYQGISTGKIKDGQHMKVYPSNIDCKIYKIKKTVDCYKIDTNIDISRGYIITEKELQVSNEITGEYISFNTKINYSNLIFKHGTSISKVISLTKNKIILSENISFANIEDIKRLGYGIIIDNSSKLNVGMFIISQNRKELPNYCYWFTGYSGSGKTTLARQLAKHFAIKPVILDGDEIRKTINYDLTLNKEDRDKNVTKIANLANLLLTQGHNVIVACISKDANQRLYAKNLLGNSYCEIYVESSETTRIRRDTKKLYKNNIKVLDNYEPSSWENIVINTDTNSVEQSTIELLEKLQAKHYL